MSKETLSELRARYPEAPVYAVRNEISDKDFDNTDGSNRERQLVSIAQEVLQAIPRPNGRGMA